MHAKRFLRRRYWDTRHCLLLGRWESHSLMRQVNGHRTFPLALPRQPNHNLKPIHMLPLQRDAWPPRQPSPAQLIFLACTPPRKARRHIRIELAPSRGTMLNVDPSDAMVRGRRAPLAVGLASARVELSELAYSSRCARRQEGARWDMSSFCGGGRVQVEQTGRACLLSRPVLGGPGQYT
jgi:hypothetical protein